MNYNKFNNYLNATVNAMDAQENQHDEKTEKTFVQNGKWALHRLEKIFCDTKNQNIRRWLNKKPCVFTSDRTGSRSKIKIGNDREALYYFLVFCKLIETGRTIDEDFRDYLALLIAKSCSENWEEC